MENLNFNNPHKKDSDSQKREKFLLNLRTEVENYSGDASPYDAKEINLISENESIGKLIFFQNDPDYGAIRISEVFLKSEYQGMGIGLKFYEDLISYAKGNHFNKVASGFSVQGGALVVWIKLAEKYQVVVNPEAKDINNKNVDFQEVVKMYQDKKLPKNYYLRVPPDKSVFEIKIEQK